MISIVVLFACLVGCPSFFVVAFFFFACLFDGRFWFAFAFFVVFFLKGKRQLLFQSLRINQICTLKTEI